MDLSQMEATPPYSLTNGARFEHNLAGTYTLQRHPSGRLLARAIRIEVPRALVKSV